MSTGELHQISQAIGALQAKTDEGGRQHQETNEKLDELMAMIAPLKDLPQRVLSVEIKMERMAMTKARATGFIAGVSAVGGIAGSVLTWVLAKFGVH